MSKFRSKLKRHTKGAKWARGQSATSNPENKKHRNAARSRFFQPNLHTGMWFLANLFMPNGFLIFTYHFSKFLDAKPSTTNGIQSLTVDAVLKHDVRQSYAIDKKVTAKSIASTRSETTVNDIAMSLRSVNMDDDSQTFAKTAQTFGTQYSSCTNMTFNK